MMPDDIFYAGIDLHSNNLTVALVNRSGKRLAHRKLPCDLKRTIDFLLPFKERLNSVSVESTFNWYWLVDGLREAGFPVVLANPAAIEQYDGLKHADDKSDAFFLAELQRLNILPTGYIYDPALRPVRDLLRRRLSLVRHRTALMLSFKSLYIRTTGHDLALGHFKSMTLAEAKALYGHPANQTAASLYHQLIGGFTRSIDLIEKEVLASVGELPFYTRLKTLPGVGVILGLTISMEVGEIGRFKTPGDFASYCRTVESKAMTNGRKKGENNQKCGNKYLAWAFVEAANFAKRFDESCRRWFDRKSARTGSIVATKALACKLAKAAWYIMRTGSTYDEGRMFAGLPGAKGPAEAACSGGRVAHTNDERFGRADVSRHKGLALNPQD